jgi:hypothetical protein
MLDQKHNLETEFMGARPPTPPLRADAPAAAPAPAMPAAPVAPPAPAPAMPPEEQTKEVTETLSQLADLRDKGAITADEYEQKKAELLGRL